MRCRIQTARFPLAGLICMSLFLAACGGGSESSTTSDSGGGSSTTPAPSPTPPADPVPPPTYNGAPIISGTAIAVVQAGALYSFTPLASDPDGDALSFAVQNKPQWANFDTQTGKLSGTPTLADAGVYSNITISVSDGAAVSSLTPFSLTITSPTPQSVTLSWTAPTENTDGSALMNLAGFTIVYGASPSTLNKSVTINNPSVSTYLVENLGPGTHYFAVSAHTASGATSDLSNVVSRLIQ